MKQSFSIEIGSILKDEKVTKKFNTIPQLLREQLIETYNPVIDHLVKLYEKNPKGHFLPKEREILIDEIDILLKKSLPEVKNFSKYFTSSDSSNSNSLTHLYNLRKKLHANKDKEAIVRELSEAYQGQFKRDFPFRHAVKIVDENGKILHENLNKEIIDGIINNRPQSQQTENKEYLSPAELEIFKKEFMKKSGANEEQMNYIIARYNQRSIGSFSASLGIQEENGIFKNIQSISTHPREETWTVKTKEDGRLTLSKLKIESTIYNPEYELDDKRKVLIDEYGNKSPTGEYLPYAKMAIEVDIEKLSRNKVKKLYTLPIHKAPEIITASIIDHPQNEEYELPECIKHRTLNNHFVAKEKAISKEKLVVLLNTPGLTHELSQQNLQKLSGNLKLNELELLVEKLSDNGLKNLAQLTKLEPQMQEEVVGFIIKAKIDNTLKSTTKTSGKPKYAQNIQESLAFIAGDEALKTNPQLSKDIRSYIENRQPSMFKRIKQLIYTTITGKDFQNYKLKKLTKHLDKISGIMSASSKKPIKPDFTPPSIGNRANSRSQ